MEDIKIYFLITSSTKIAKKEAMAHLKTNNFNKYKSRIIYLAQKYYESFDQYLIY